MMRHLRRNKNSAGESTCRKIKTMATKSKAKKPAAKKPAAKKKKK
jgi:hypothetical protein